MIELTAGEHEFRFAGDHVECVIAAIHLQKAEEWLKRGAEALFLHTVATSEDDLDDIKSDPAFIGNFRDLRDAVHLEGCELHNGTFEFLDATGAEIESLSTESSDFEDYVDDTLQIDPDSHLIEGQATLIVRTFYTGETAYSFNIPDADEFGWYVAVADMGTEPFIGTLTVDGNEISPGGSGRYESQVVTLNVPDGNGGVRTISHSERSVDV